MRYFIDKSLNTPAYLQLYEQVRDDIASGGYVFGEKLPTKRQMASETSVSTVTVEHAYALLADEGYIEPRQRSGYLVTFKVSDGFAPPMQGQRTSLDKGDDFLDTSAALSPSTQRVQEEAHAGGEIPAFPYSVVAKTARFVLSEYGPDVLKRCPGTGCVELREVLADYLRRKLGISAGVDQIVIGSGAENLYFSIIGLLGHDITVGLESPSYEKIRQVYTLLGARCELLSLGSDGIESAELEKSSADLLHITPYRSFPTGVTASISKRYEYLRWASGKKGLIVEDDFESEFSVSGKPVESVFSLSTEDNVIYLNTFSMSISPSLRMGYMVLPRHLVDAYHERLGFLSCSVPTFDQLVVARLISSGDFSRHVNRVRRAKRKALKGEGVIE